MLDTLMGPPRHKVPFYDFPAYTGKEVHPEMLAGTRLGPVNNVFQAVAQYVGTHWMGGMTCRCIVNPFLVMENKGLAMTEEEKFYAGALPELFWVNVCLALLEQNGI